MARVQYGLIITGIKGKVGGQVLQGGNGAQVLRNSPYKAGTSSLRRQGVVSNMISITALWKTLNQTQYASWLALAPNWPFTNKFGAVYYSNAYQVFVACNTALVSLGQFPILVAPTVQENESIELDTFVVANGESFNISITDTTTAEMIVQVYASAPLSPGVHRNSVPFKLLGQFNAFETDEYDGGNAYINAYGAIPTGALYVVKLITRNLQFPLVFQTIIDRTISFDQP